MKKAILINGAIRDIEEFLLIMDCVLFYVGKSSEAIDIIVSTWHEDVNKNIDIFSWLSSKGVKIVGSSGIADGGPANIFRQWRTLEAGLSILDKNTVVLKGRTDKFLLRKDVIESFVNLDMPSGKFKCFIESNHVAVEHVSLSLPFMAKDMIFLGTVNSLRKVLHYSVRTKYVAEHIYSGIGPECFLWLEGCRTDHDVMSLIQKVDLRFLSNDLMAHNDIFKYDWSKAKPETVFLIKKWISIFDKNSTFISDVLSCASSPSWGINEGIYRYQTGDRTEFERLREIISSCHQDETLDISSMNFINSTSVINSFGNEGVIEPILPFSNDIDKIRSDPDRSYSDIVLLRKRMIENELAQNVVDADKLSHALHWNIRQRDRDTLNIVYTWMLSDDRNLKYVHADDITFVLERMLDFFTFSSDSSATDEAVRKLRQYFRGSAALEIRLAEDHFRNRKLLKALFWFSKAYKSQPNSLGVAHGLGCTLLDLGFPRFAVRFLKKAHSIMPSDQTATFTLVRALAPANRKREAKVLVQGLSGHLLQEAEKIVNAN